MMEYLKIYGLEGQKTSQFMMGRSIFMIKSDTWSHDQSLLGPSSKPDVISLKEKFFFRRAHNFAPKSQRLHTTSISAIDRSSPIKSF